MENTIKLANVGFNNTVNANNILAVITSNCITNRRIIKAKKDLGLLLDCTCGRADKSIIITNDGYLILCALNTSTINMRVNNADIDNSISYEDELLD